MNCPRCGEKSEVEETRPIKGGTEIRRRRECTECHYRFSTYEQTRPRQLYLVKSDGSTTRFNQERIFNDLCIVFRNHPLEQQTNKFREIARRIEEDFRDKADEDTVSAKEIGERLLEEVIKIDTTLVAYTRLASMINKFRQVEDFQKLIQFSKDLEQYGEVTIRLKAECQEPEVIGKLKLSPGMFTIISYPLWKIHQSNPKIETVRISLSKPDKDVKTKQQKPKEM